MGLVEYILRQIIWKLHLIELVDIVFDLIPQKKADPWVDQERMPDSGW